MKTKEGAEKAQFRTCVKGSDKSISHPDLTIKEVIQLKLDYIVERLDYPPHIHFITMQQMLWQFSKEFGLVLTDPVNVGLIGSYNQLKHIGGRKPTDYEYAKMVANFGFALPFPPQKLGNLILNAFRELEDKCVDEELPILPAPFTGYIDPKTNKLIRPNNHNQEWHGGKISGYVLFKTDSNSYQTVSEYILGEAPLWQKLQLERAKKTAPELRESKRRTAEVQGEKAEKRLIGLGPLLGLSTGLSIKNWDEHENGTLKTLKE